MLEKFGERIERAVFEGVGRASSRVQERRPLPADLLESDDAYLAVFDTPGASAADVEVDFEDDTVYVRIDRFREYYEDFERPVPGDRGGRVRGVGAGVRRELDGPAERQPADATATVTRHGTLEVRIPKAEGAGTAVTVSEEDAGDERGRTGVTGSGGGPDTSPVGTDVDATAGDRGDEPDEPGSGTGYGDENGNRDESEGAGAGGS